MYSKLSVVIFASTLLISCVSSRFADSLKKCAVDDSSCFQGLVENVVQDIGKGGIQEYNIAPIDPFDIKDVEISLLGLLNIKIEEGEVRGLKDCVFDNVIADPKEKRFGLEVVCDVNIKVKIKLDDISPFLQNTFGTKALNGGGNAKAKLEKLKLKVDFFYDLVKKEDGELYISIKPKETVYEYNIGGAQMVVDKLLLGDKDASKQLNEFFEQNLTFVLKTFGNDFFKVAFDILNNLLTTFFDKTPTKYFISTDLTPYL